MAGSDDAQARQAELGILTAQGQIAQNTDNLLEVAATVAALAEVLAARGLVEPEVLEQARGAARERLRATEFGQRIAVRLQDDGRDKYTAENAEVDCGARMHICHSACCAFDVPLSRQDLEEGQLRWELSRPYVLRHGADGLCMYRDPATGFCGSYENRPLACRKYTCKTDRRVWKDFDRMIPNTESLDALVTRVPRLRLRAPGEPAGAVWPPPVEETPIPPAGDDAEE